MPFSDKSNSPFIVRILLYAKSLIRFFIMKI